MFRSLALSVQNVPVKTGSSNTQNNFNTPESIDNILLKNISSNTNQIRSTVYPTQESNAQRITTPYEDFVAYRNQEQVNFQIMQMAAPLLTPDPRLSGYGVSNRVQLWADMSKNPGKYRMMPPAMHPYGNPLMTSYQAVQNDPDLARLLLGIMATPYVNQNMNDSQKKYTYNQGLQWVMNFVTRFGTPMHNASDVNNDKVVDLRDLISVTSSASYSGTGQL